MIDAFFKGLGEELDRLARRVLRVYLIVFFFCLHWLAEYTRGPLQEAAIYLLEQV